ncbi:Ribosomal RNA adenine dimethylase domain-containing protein 1 [Boothiomyces sp. JEL0866]|nr:Ribosomal RNA adenine dimethylase domain-containing protein 1 [Boothiomyces sp. JEL0866]
MTLEFCKKYSFLSKGHYFDLATHSLHDYPPEWLDFVDSSPDSIINEFANVLLAGTNSELFPQSLQNWISETKSHYLDKTPKNPQELELKLKYVKRKKLHEIRRLGCVILDTVKKLNIDYVVDIGAGVGHLTRVLSKHCPVIAIECNSEYSNQIKKDENIVVVNRLIDKTNLMSILDSVSLTGTFLLTGLHSCGDLSSLITLDAFKNNDRVKAVVTVGCCFQLISEFPKCRDFKDKLTLIKPQLNSACHVYTDFTQERLVSYWKSLGYRARLNHVLNLDVGTKLRFPSNITFERYVELASEQLGTVIKLDDGEKYFKIIGFISLLRGLFSPVLEKLILLDRLYYLQEDGYTAELVALFDPKLSPRNMVLIARK